MEAGPSIRTKQYLTFSVGDARFAAIAADVSEVVRRAKITRVPNGPPSLLGVTSFRGSATPVISLARLLGQETSETLDGRLLLLDGRIPIGLAVDHVGSLATMDPGDPDESEGRQGFGRLYVQDQATLRILDLEALLRGEFSNVMGKSRRVAAGSETRHANDEIDTDMVGLLGFDLAGQAYALHLEEVAEVLPLPPQMASPAQSDDAMLGVIDLRGRLLPIASLRRLLGLPATYDPSQRIVVVRIGETMVGLAVDRLRAILRVRPDAIDAAPAALNRGAGEAQVQTIGRLPDGAGLVAILSSERLFREEKVAHILADGRNKDAGTVVAMDDVDHRTPFLILRLGKEEYGFPLDAVDEVVRAPDRLTRVPKAPAFIEGVFNLRGRVVPVINQRSRFGVNGERSATRARIIVTTVEGRQAGFVVDAASEIISLSPSQIGVTPELTASAGQLFSRIATLDGGKRLILLIEPRELLDRAERDLLDSLEMPARSTTA